jgi:DNA primase
MGLLHAVEEARSHLKKEGKPYPGSDGRMKLNALCPLHDDHHPSFSLNLETGMWVCRSGCGGGWIDTLLLRLGYAKTAIESLLKGEIRPQRPSKIREHVLKQRRMAAEVGELPEETVLSFFRNCPVTLLEQGWPEAQLAKFDVGYDKGVGRITYPIRNWNGGLAAISGRTIYEGVEPKYRIYEEKDLYELAPQGYIPPRYRLLYNVDRVVVGAHVGDRVTIHEGFKEVIRMDMANIPSLGLAGASFSAEQVRLLNRLVYATGCKLVVMLDNDKAGKHFAVKLCNQLSAFTIPHIAFTSTTKDVSDETDLNKLRRTVHGAPTFAQWINTVGRPGHRRSQFLKRS